MSKNVAVFVDVANIFYAAKAAGADIDYVTLLKAAVSGRDFVRAYAYTGLDPENENQRNFHAFLARHGYKVVSKDIRKYGDGKVKANLDIELVVDMMKTSRNLDVAVVISGDGDFAPAIRAVQEMGVRVEVISFRGNTSSDLIDVADAFYDITQLAKVDRESSRSGRRVADDEEDLSMTEVPDKQTEGRGDRRRRTARRGHTEPVEEVVTVSDGRRSRGGRGTRDFRDSRDTRDTRVSRDARDIREPREDEVRAAAEGRGDGRGLVALPGERLSKASGKSAQPIDEELIEDGAEDQVVGESDVASGEGVADEAAGRRRRRRGGRGRGRGHGTEFAEGAEAGEAGAEPGAEASELEEIEPVAPAKRPNQFGSVWDSQIGMAGRPERLAPITPDEDDFAEPEIPEYLLAERRRSSGAGARGGRGQGGRGVRSGYAAAVERERYGGSGRSRFAEPVRAPQPPSRGPRRDDRPARGPDRGPDRSDRPQRQQQPQQRRSPAPQRQGGGRDSSEPWSEVPPELEELLRAQLSAKMSRPEPRPRGEAAGSAAESTESASSAASSEASTALARAPRGRGRRKPAESADTGEFTTAVEAIEVMALLPESSSSGEIAPAAPKTRSRRKAAPAVAEVAAEAAPASEATEGAATPAPKKRAVRRKPAATEAAPEGETPAGE